MSSSSEKTTLIDCTEAEHAVAILAILNEAIVKVLGDGDLRASLLERGAEVTPSTPDALAKFIAAEIPRWGAAVKRSNARVE